MNALEIHIRPDAALLPPVLSSVKVYAKSFFKSRKDIDRIVLAAEEAIDNVLNYSLSGHLEEITITANGADGEFTVCVLDRGLPGNYEETLKGDDRLGLTIMQSAVDVAKVENLGYDGRRQKLIKYYSKMPDLTAPENQPDEAVIENAEITVRTPTREDMLAVARAFYGEYGLTYVNEIVYFPDRFYAAVKKDEIHSTVAVDQFGNVAGHHAVSQWSNVPGIWESGMAVVNKRYRNAGVFAKMMERTYHYVHDEVKGKIFLGCCVTTHPYSQKLRLKYGSFPCGFCFNLVPPSMFQSSFIGEDQYSHEAYAASAFDFTEKTVYLPKELEVPARFIYDGMKLPRVICTDILPPEAEHTESSWEYSDRLHVGFDNIKVIGADCGARLRRDALDIRTRSAEVISLNVSIERPGFTSFYELAKSEGFFFTGLLPNADQGDIIVMQKLFSRAIDYDGMVTVEPYTTLLNMIRPFDPDQQKS